MYVGTGFPILSCGYSGSRSLLPLHSAGALVCDVGCDDVALFLTSPEVAAPETVRDGLPFEVTVRVTPAFSGTGSVRLIGRAHRLDTLAPVADSVGCFRADAPVACVGVSLGTKSARWSFDGGQEASLTWTVRLHEGPSPDNPPKIGAAVVIDSVHAPGGLLYSLSSREAIEIVGGADFVRESGTAFTSVRIGPRAASGERQPVETTERRRWRGPRG